MFDAGNQFWYVLMTSQNYSGLYCMGLHTQDGRCTDNKMSIGSAADSMYEYMIKQWVLSGKTQEVGVGALFLPQLLCAIQQICVCAADVMSCFLPAAAAPHAGCSCA
eukprot:GHRQ01038435.1.p3 GENE.GHRQ01038435.1~~GHRQ01038435.1.p3  ORF type:complete len:107 (+),score=41.12 GHRQ01038435.1:129-449(+)